MMRHKNVLLIPSILTFWVQQDLFKSYSWLNWYRIVRAVPEALYSISQPKSRANKTIRSRIFWVVLAGWGEFKGEKQVTTARFITSWFIASVYTEFFQLTSQLNMKKWVHFIEKKNSFLPGAAVKLFLLTLFSELNIKSFATFVINVFE
jgi:hypothetical protein